MKNQLKIKKLMLQLKLIQGQWFIKFYNYESINI